MVSNIYLNNLGKYLKNYEGTFSSDNIKKYNSRKKNCTFIINLSKTSEKGTHLIAVQIKKSRGVKVFYFDSFGLPCYNKDILNFIHNISNKYSYNNLQIQHPNSDYCGVYCLGFVMHQDDTNKNYKDFLKMFNSDNLFSNDKKIVSYITNNKHIFSRYNANHI